MRWRRRRLRLRLPIGLRPVPGLRIGLERPVPGLRIGLERGSFA